MPMDDCNRGLETMWLWAASQQASSINISLSQAAGNAKDPITSSFTLLKARESNLMVFPRCAD